MKLYKLTDADGYTNRGRLDELRWGWNITHEVGEVGPACCPPGVIYAFEHPLVGLFMKRTYADENKPLIWEAKGDVVFRDGWRVCGVKKLTTLKIVGNREIDRRSSVRFAIGCAWHECQNVNWRRWATEWIAMDDRSPQSAVKKLAHRASRQIERESSASRAIEAAYCLFSYDWAAAGAAMAISPDIDIRVIAEWAMLRERLEDLDRQMVRSEWSV